MTLREHTQCILDVLQSSIDEKNLRLLAPDQSQDQTENIIKKYIHEAPKNDQQRLTNEFFNDGPIAELIADTTVTEIMITPKSIHFEREGCIFEHSDRFLSDFTFNQFIHKVFDEAGTHITLQRPFVDGSWKQFRLHAVGTPLTSEKIVITLRRHSRAQWNLESLVSKGMFETADALRLQDSYKNKKNILIVGTTGCGKTTLINALIQTSLPNERVVSIEDTDELILPSSVSVKLLTRSVPTDSLPAIDQQQLLHQALRMRPDRILLGEVRGSEAKDLLLTLSTGHSGFLGSLHAQSAKEALWRLEMLIQMGAPQWNIETIRRLIQSSIDEIVVLERQKKQRRIKEHMRLVSLESHGFIMEPMGDIHF